MNPLLRHVHDNEVANIQAGIKLKQLSRGIVITRETAQDKFEMNVFVVPAVPPDQITVQIDPSKLADGGRRTFRDFGM